MGNDVSRTAALKRVFQKLDADQQGVLTLDQILSVKKIPGVTHPISNSALLLLRFDESLEGTINFKEFRNLLDHIRNAELKAKGRKKKKRNKLKVWSAVSRDTVTKSELSRNTETPAWTGRKPSSNHDSDSEESAEGSDKSTENDDSLTEDIEETLKVEAKAFFDKMIKSDEGREKFIQWLWRLADTDKNNLVAADELTCVLKALRADGINPENLVYENDDDIKTTDLSKKDQTIAKKLLEEFDKGQTGFLTQEEFTILADLILKNYEIKSEYESGDILGDYELKRRLGRGASGEVRLAVHHITGDRRAIKICPKGNIASLARLDTEIKAMLMLQHKHIVSLYEVLESEDNVFFVMELCGGGSLYEYMGNKPLSEDTARYYFSQIIEGVSYSHAMGVVHRDLKLDNLLLDNNANIKITDFGHAGIFQKGWDLFCTPTVGGLCHVAPEQLLGQPYSGEKNDIWGLGVILYILLVGALPFKGQAYLDNIRNGRYTIPEHLSPEVRDLISNMLVTDPNGRIGCRKIMKHPWLTMGKKDSPNLDRFQLPIQPEKAVWNLPGGKICALCNVLRDLEIVTLHLNDKPQAEKDKIRCHYPEKEIKFYFKLKRDPQTNEQFFRFKLAEGESRDFLGIMPKIRMGIEDAERNLQSGTASVKNTIQMRLGTKKPSTKKNLVENDKETNGSNKDDKEKTSSKRNLQDDDKDEKDSKERRESKRNIHDKEDKDGHEKDKKDSRRTLDAKHDKDRDHSESPEEVRSSRTIRADKDKDYHDREVQSEKISKRATMDERLLDKSREIEKLKEIHEDKPMSTVISKKHDQENGSSTNGSKRAMERSKEIERPKDKHHGRDELRGSQSDILRRRKKPKRASKRSISSESSETHSTSESIGSSSGSRRDGDRD